MTIRDATRLLTERGCRVGWFDRRPGIAKDLRYATCVLYRTAYVTAFGATVQAAYDDAIAALERVDRKEAGEVMNAIEALPSDVPTLQAMVRQLSKENYEIRGKFQAIRDEKMGKEMVERRITEMIDGFTTRIGNQGTQLSHLRSNIDELNRWADAIEAVGWEALSNPAALPRLKSLLQRQPPARRSYQKARRRRERQEAE